MRDTSGLFTFTSVLGLVADKDGSLWILLRDLSMLRYRNGGFEDPFPKGRVLSNFTALARINGGELLTARMQLGAFTFRGAQLQLLAGATGVPRSPVVAVAKSGDGSYWLGTRGAGLFQLRAGKTFPIQEDTLDPKINCLLPDGAKDL